MSIKKLKTLATVVAALGAVLAAPAHAGKTLDAIKARGQVVCGVNTGLAGFGAADSNGKWTGLDVDVCRAVAAAVLGDGEKVKYVPLNAHFGFHTERRQRGVDQSAATVLTDNPQRLPEQWDCHTRRELHDGRAIVLAAADRGTDRLDRFLPRAPGQSRTGAAGRTRMP